MLGCLRLVVLEMGKTRAPKQTSKRCVGALRPAFEPLTKIVRFKLLAMANDILLLKLNHRCPSKDNVETAMVSSRFLPILGSPSLTLWRIFPITKQ